MSNFQLQISQVLQGEFQLKSLNLVLVFQVNCPGCFIYALPLAARLHESYGNRINILGLSTAFEDYSLNTLDNTRSLLERGTVVGMTKRYLQQQGEDTYTVPIRFPVAFDRLQSTAIDHPPTAERSISPHDVAAMGYTFRTNHLRGTPAWILFDESSRILVQWFGHKSESSVELILRQALAVSAV